MVYLDNAATSFPKPPAVAEAMADFLHRCAANPGRAGHRLAVDAQAVVDDTRRRLARLLGASEPSRIAFTSGATDALNQALWGLLRPGERVVSTGMEHNALARPLRALAARGVDVARVPCAPDGTLDLADLERALRAAPTRLVAMTHASNVAGTLHPAGEAARLAHAHGALLLLDAAQTAGAVPLDVQDLGVDLLAFPGHKGLLGPTGTGGLYIAPGVQLTPLRQGGTGTRSEEDEQPRELPDALEAGTLNTVGLAGLGAALHYLEERGVPSVRAHERALTERLLAGLRELHAVQVHGPTEVERRVAVVSLSLEGWEPMDVGAVLDSSFTIAVRTGLHCAPLAHRTLGTHPGGTVRLSLGCFNGTEDVDRALVALRELLP